MIKKGINKLITISINDLARKIKEEKDIKQLKSLAFQLVIELKGRIKPITLIINSKGKLI